MRSAVLFCCYLIFPIFPLTRMFGVKASLLRFAGGVIGQNVRIASSARFYVGGGLQIGDNCWIGEDVLATGGDADIVLGKDCDIGPRVTLVTGSHRLWETPERAAGSGMSLPIRIGDGVWIGAGATILGGVEIGDCAMVAAGAIVNSDVAPYSMVAGIPAKLVRRYPNESEG